MGGPIVEEMARCKCGQEFEILWGSCGFANCPSCGATVKIGACGE